MRVTDLALLTEARTACQDGSARELRTQARVSQAEVAAACGVSPKTVAGWEAARRRPTGGGALAYARWLRAVRPKAAA